jgi:putative ABC transport system permease protein
VSRSAGRARPPRLATALLDLALPPGPRSEAVLGDLEELWRERRAARGRAHANLWYSGQALSTALHLLPGQLKDRSIMDHLGQQLRLVVRRLLRAPLFTTVALVTLAVGIGSNAAIFSVVEGVLLKPLPFQDPDRLVGVWHTAPGLGFPEVNQSPALHYTYVADSHTFEDVGMWDDETASVTGLAEPEQVPAMRVTWRTIPLLKIRPVLGRSFTDEEDTPDGPDAVILSYGYWQRRFGGDRSVLGRSLTVNAVPRVIVGVMPRDLHFLRSDPALYLPFGFDQKKLTVGNFSYQGVARLKPGVTVEEANADVNRMIPIAIGRYPGGFSLGMLKQARFAAAVHPLKQDVVGDVGNVLWVLLGTVGIVLLIACANVANLFLVRAEGRQREMAVRTAMGAGRGRIAAELLTESLVLGVLGGVLGLMLAFAGLKLLVALGPRSVPRLQEIGIDGRVLAFTLGLSVFAGIIFGAYPALRAGASQLVTALKEGGRGSGVGRERHVARSALVVTQMALALVLLAGSGLMIRSFRALRSVNPGFTAPEEVVTFRVSIPEAEDKQPEQVALDFREILRRVQALGGVASAAFSSSVTLDMNDNNDAVEVEGLPVDPDQIPPIRRFKFIGEGYHTTMGNPVLAGRSITWADIDDRARVAVVTEDLARAYWPDPAQAVGKRIREFSTNGEAPWHEIVGVVGSIHDNGIGQATVPTVFWPQVVDGFWVGSGRVYTPRSLSFAVRARSGDPTALVPELRKAVWAVNPNLPVADVNTVKGLEARSLASTSFTLVMLAIAAGVALFLGTVGIYGVISYVVSQRTREIGVRMAVGAERVDVTRMVLREAAVLAASGVVVGLAASLGLTRLMASLLYGVSPVDPITFAAVAVALTLVALVASLIPASRAARVDPVVALRFE